jgi:GWxTD domain-containing protein
VISSDTIEQVPLLPLSNIALMKESDTPRYAFAATKAGAKTVAILIPLNGEKLPLRPLAFKIKITQDGSEVNFNQDFRTIWPDMPLSLRDVDFALEALRHITREDELDSLRSGSRDARLVHLEEFWKKKDRTPDTEHNDMMVEYYRRVDHTQRMFSSMREFDGYKTDRGRIYILYGPPSRTERTLDPSAGYQEVWYYEGKSKRFTFVDQSKSGKYTLVSSQNF